VKRRLGNIPDNWSWESSGEVIDVRDGTHDTPKYVSEGFPLVTSKNLKPQGIDFADVGFISKGDHVAISKRSHVDRGDILFAMIGTIGNPTIVDDDREFSIKNVALFKCTKGRVEPQFWYRMLGSPLVKMQLDDATRGGTQKFVSLKVLRNLQIPLPPLDEQKRIAGILDAADTLRTKRRESLAQLDILLQSTFLDMFGDPVINPMGWDVRELAEVVETGTIVTYGIVQAGDEYPGGIPYIRTGDLVEGEVQLEGLRHTDPEIAAKFERSRVCAGEIVMSIRATVGTTARVPSQLDGANLTQGTARISPGEDTVPSFLLSFIRSQGSQAWLRRQVKGATFREITLKRLRQMPIHVPPIDLQRRFATIVESIEQQKTSQRAHLDELDTLFVSLQSRAFRGDL
jgi:type I restriction enzyme, S subunit